MFQTQQSTTNLSSESLDAFTEGSIWEDVKDFLVYKQDRKRSSKLLLSVKTRKGYGQVSIDETLRLKFDFGSATRSELPLSHA